VFHSLPFIIHQFRCEAANGMRLRPDQRGFGTAAGTLIALAVLLCAWPSKADAGCSHYAVANTYSGSGQLDIFEHEGEINVSSEAPAPPKPCSGALCSGKPAVPVPVPIAVGTTRADQWGLVDPRLPAPSELSRLFAYAERIVRAVIEGPSIERPPR
jgi:hypothetical protein